MNVSGRVSKVFEKSWDGRNGTVLLHSFQVEGNNKYFRTGEERLCRQGDTVEFTADDRGNVANLMVVDGGSAPAQSNTGAQPSSRSTSYSGKSGGGNTWKAKQAEKDQYWSDKESRDIAREQRQQTVVEPRITWSSAQSDAVALVTTALQHDLLAFGNANKSAKLGLLLDYVDQVTKRFADQRWRASELLQEALTEAGDGDTEAAAGRPDVDLG